MQTKNKKENPFLYDLKQVVYDLSNFVFKPTELAILQRMAYIPNSNYSGFTNTDWCSFFSYNSKEESPVEGIKNWLRYRILRNFRVNEDCDCNKWVFDLYNKIFNQHNDFEKAEPKLRSFKVGNIVLETDTMNSFATLFNQFMRTRLPKDWKEKYCRLFRLEDTAEPYRDLYFLVIIDELYEKWQTEQKNLLVEFNKFAHLTGCLANMILVPSDYNTGRSGITKDFWDLSLIDLQGKYTQSEYYDEGFAFISENMENLLLSDWFEDMSGVSFDKYKVKLLFKGHSFKNMMPTSDAEFLECLCEINQRIEERAKNLNEKFPDFII